MYMHYSAINFAPNLVYFSSGGKFCPWMKKVELKAFTHDALLAYTHTYIRAYQHGWHVAVTLCKTTWTWTETEYKNYSNNYYADHFYVPTPKGYLPTLVVSLLNSPEFETDEPIVANIAISWASRLRYHHTCGGQDYFIENNRQLEIYYSQENEEHQHCSVIRSKILEVLVEVEKKLQFQPDILVKEDVFVCSCNGPDPRHFYTYDSQIKKVLCENI